MFLQLAVYLMTNKSANTSEGHCQEVCFLDNIHLAGTQNFGL